MTKYIQDSGDWFSFELGDAPSDGVRQQCCGCGLVHDINVRKKGRLYEMQIIRNERATSATRRGRLKRIVVDD